MEFEFADAEVAACHVEDGVLTVRFAAARVQTHTGAHARAEAQWMPLVLVAEGVDGAAELLAGAEAAAWQGRLHDGLLVDRTQGRRWRSLPLPFESAHAVCLELEFVHGLCLQAMAHRVRVQAPTCGLAVGAYQC